MFRTLLFCFLLLGGTTLSAQNTPATPAKAMNISGPTSSDGVNPSMVTKLAVLAGLSLLPFAIMLLTSFMKIVIVLSLLRNALGVQQTPPNQVLNGIALLLTIYVMFPTGLAMYTASQDVINKTPPTQIFSDQSANYIIAIIDKAKEPMRTFLLKNT